MFIYKSFFSSYIEIYNEQVRDLLRSARSKDKKPDNLRIREHPKEGPFVQGILGIHYTSLENRASTSAMKFLTGFIHR